MRLGLLFNHGRDRLCLGFDISNARCFMLIYAKAVFLPISSKIDKFKNPHARLPTRTQNAHLGRNGTEHCQQIISTVQVVSQIPYPAST